MFRRILQKELLHHLLDLRFIAVMALCVLLSLLSVYVGTRTYQKQKVEYSTAFERNRSHIENITQHRGWLRPLLAYGYTWNRGPETLSPLVYGMSGKLGQEVRIYHRRLLTFSRSLFSIDPIRALFGMLDFAFVVKFILSLCVLLLTFDAVCGEKESGTLRIFSSFPVARSTLALGKLAGSTIAVLVPFVLSYLLASLVLAFSPELEIEGDELGRMAALLGVFILYLTVFAAFGLWASALTQRRLTSLLALLGLWTLWVFIVPNLAVRAARSVEPVAIIYNQEREAARIGPRIRAEMAGEGESVQEAFGRRHGLATSEDWTSISDELYGEWMKVNRLANTETEERYYTHLRPLVEKRQNEIQKQNHLAQVLAAVSPLGAVSFVSIDLARTGILQQERLKKALDRHWSYLAGFMREKRAEEHPDLSGFVPFDYKDEETVLDCLSRNVFGILNLVLLAVLGFVGAYVAILRYDVR